MAAIDDPNAQRLSHGTKADLKPGDLGEPGYSSNYGQKKRAAYVYLTATLNAATWGAVLALGEGPGRIDLVEPTGPIEDDPNLTDKRYPGHPTKSYRSRDPLRVTGEVTDWQGPPPKRSKPCRTTLPDGGASVWWQSKAEPGSSIRRVPCAAWQPRHSYPLLDRAPRPRNRAAPCPGSPTGRRRRASPFRLVVLQEGEHA